jgi:hypothetical protein
VTSIRSAILEHSSGPSPRVLWWCAVDPNEITAPLQREPLLDRSLSEELAHDCSDQRPVLGIELSLIDSALELVKLGQGDIDWFRHGILTALDRPSLIPRSIRQAQAESQHAKDDRQRPGLS